LRTNGDKEIRTVQKKFLAISGTNRLGTGDLAIDGEVSLEDIHADLRKRATELDVQVDWCQLNGEGKFIDCLRKSAGNYAGAIINAGSLAHDGHALRSAIESAPFPCVEISPSKVHKGEEFSHKSVITSACVGVIGGFGKRSYLLALDALVNLTNG
jgi:3-dehydroquinate dehydratase II